MATLTSSLEILSSILIVKNFETKLRTNNSKLSSSPWYDYANKCPISLEYLFRQHIRNCLGSVSSDF